MTLSTTARRIIIAFAIVWTLAIAAMVAAAATTKSSTSFNTQGALERQVVAIEGLGLNATALSLADIYGEEYFAAAIICPGETADSLRENYLLGDSEIASLDLADSVVAEGSSYFVLQKEDGSVEIDTIDPAKVDLCQVPLAGYFDTRSMIPLSKIAEGQWTLLV